MGEKTLKFGERLFFMMVWIVIILIATGFVIHWAKSRGILPGFLQNALGYTNLSAQAGG